MTLLSRLLPGPRILEPSGSTMIGYLRFPSSYVASVSVIADLVSAMEGAGLVEVTAVRGEISPLAPGQWVASRDELDARRLEDVSSSDLRCVFIQGLHPAGDGAGGHGGLAAGIQIGSGTRAQGWAAFADGSHPQGNTDETMQLLQRFADLIPADSRLRMTRGARRRLFAYALAGAILIAWLLTVILTWFDLPLALFTALAGTAFYWQVSTKLVVPDADDEGRVYLDPTRLSAIRDARANNHRDLKVGLYTGVPVLLAAAVTALLSWYLGLLPPSPHAESPASSGTVSQTPNP